jgi:hypothetical protein
MANDFHSFQQSIFKQILEIKLKEESGSAVSKYTGKVRLTFLDKVYIICVPDLKLLKDPSLVFPSETNLSHLFILNWKNQKEIHLQNNFQNSNTLTSNATYLIK